MIPGYAVNSRASVAKISWQTVRNVIRLLSISKVNHCREVRYIKLSKATLFPMCDFTKKQIESDICHFLLRAVPLREKNWSPSSTIISCDFSVKFYFKKLKSQPSVRTDQCEHNFSYDILKQQQFKHQLYQNDKQCSDKTKYTNVDTEGILNYK